jgi:hypothetical protein
MTCSGCGLRSCDGRCFHESPADYAPEEAPAPRAKYVPSPEYLAWCAEVDSKRTTVTHGDPLLEKRDRRVA